MLAPPAWSQAQVVPWWQKVVAMGVTELTPQTLGFLRSRWCCAVIVVVRWERSQLQVSAETVRRGLHREQLVWRRPRPVVGPTDPERAAVLRDLRQVLATLPADEIAVSQAEVDINTNPKIGAMGMRRGQQAEMPTPGTTDKRSLAGSLNGRTGALLVTAGWPTEGRSAALFVRHLDDLRWQLRRYRKIHVICDQARLHDCQLVWQYLEQWGHRLALHSLPTYSPDTNPIERVWWHLHEEITRCHRCQTMDELLDVVFAWLQHRTPFAIEGSVYPQSQAA